MTMTPPTDHQVLVFFVALAVIVVVAKGLGTLMRRIGQPAVVGELAAGLVLGPSLLGRIAPDVTDWLFPEDSSQTAMLFTVGWLGVMFLLVSTGFETDLGLIRRLGKAAGTVSAGSLLVPIVAGFAVGWMIPDDFVGGGTERYVFALFIAAALSISSLPVIAKILTEMGLMRRNFGQLTLAAGMANDVIGWLLLGFVAGLARGGLELGRLAFTMIGLAVFFLAAFTIGQRLLDLSLRRVRLGGDDPVAGLVVVLVMVLAFGMITQWLHVEAVLGAFVAGVVLARSRFAEHSLIRPLETVTSALLAPVFFATAGLRVDLGLLADPMTLVWAIVVVAVASLSKFVGAWLGARAGALSDREGAALGIALNARGALEIVIATVGLSLGVLNERSYTVVVLMAMATSMLAPPLLRAVLKNFDGTASERARLDTEALLATNSIVTSKGVLIPTRGGVSSLMAAQVVGIVWPDDTPVTLLTIGKRDFDVRPFEAVLAGKKVSFRAIEGGLHAVDDVQREAQLGYGAVVIGAGVESPTGVAISPFVDELIVRSPVPVAVVRLPRGQRHRLPWAFSRAVVPVNGGRAGTAALEVAGHLSASLGTHLHTVYVDTEPVTGAPARERQARAGGRDVLDHVAGHLTRLNANFTTRLMRAPSPACAVADSVEELGADLVIAGGVQRGQGGSLVLGNTVERILGDCDVTLILVVSSVVPRLAARPMAPSTPASAPTPSGV